MFFCALSINAQKDEKAVQISGVISTLDGEQLIPVPYCGIVLKNSQEGVYSNESGFFSVAAGLEDTLIIKHINYDRLELPIRDLEIDDVKKTILVELIESPETLPEVVIYPWPSKEFFEIEFLNLEVDDSLGNIAQKHLEREVLQELASHFQADATELGKLELRNIAKSYYSIGQDPYLPIFDAIAWGKFINQLSQGKIFGKKKKDEEDEIKRF